MRRVSTQAAFTFGTTAEMHRCESFEICFRNAVTGVCCSRRACKTGNVRSIDVDTQLVTTIELPGFPASYYLKTLAYFPNGSSIVAGGGSYGDSKIFVLDIVNAVY